MSEIFFNVFFMLVTALSIVWIGFLAWAIYRVATWLAV